MGCWVLGSADGDVESAYVCVGSMVWYATSGVGSESGFWGDLDVRLVGFGGIEAELEKLMEAEAGPAAQGQLGTLVE